MSESEKRMLHTRTSAKMPIRFDLSELPRELHLFPPVTSVIFVRFNYAVTQSVTDWQICYHPSGSPEVAEMKVNGTLYKATYPHLLIKRPGDKLRSAHGEGQSLYFKYAPETSLELPDGLVLQGLTPSPAISRLSGELQSELEYVFVPGAADRIDRLCMSLLSEFLLAMRSHPPECRQRTRIREAASYLYAHPMPYFGRLDDLARKFGFSRRNFARLWRAEFGTSPGRSLKELRFAEACRLLSSTDLTISEIATQLGYSEATNFVAAFRKYAHCTPRAYRLKYRA
ncbi:MAG: helix-turn-helix transcriptional regulator [Lentisphaerae bacterium]|jgi:AraC-like DNA-binding protein|nr:helix-turn-helix transcriptional regulator [Lentisphaerota bacterium]